MPFHFFNLGFHFFNLGFRGLVLGSNFLMVCLLLLIGLEGIFGFVQIKKNKKTVGVCKSHISRSADFGWHMWLTPVVVMALPPHYLICLGVLFLPGGRMYGGSAGLAGNDFFFPSLSFWDCVLAMQKIIPTF